MEINLFELLTYFIIYSVLGWVMESIVRTIAERKIINTGFLTGPLCPIYGFGACIMILFLSHLKSRIVLLFVISVVVLSAWEYVVGVLLEKLFHTKYWDYSDHKFNIQGRVCLTNSICWGVIRNIICTLYSSIYTINNISYGYRAITLYYVDFNISNCSRCSG